MRLVLTCVWVVAVVLATFAVHEAAHGLMGAALGYDMIVRLNGARPVDATGLTFVQRDLISAAGPALTLAQGFAAAWLARAWRPAFTIALAAFMMRVLAAVASIRNPNDEARLGVSWDLGPWTVHVLVVGALAYAVLLAARSARPGWGQALLTAFFVLIGLTLAVALNSFLPAVTIPKF